MKPIILHLWPLHAKRDAKGGYLTVEEIIRAVKADPALRNYAERTIDSRVPELSWPHLENPPFLLQYATGVKTGKWVVNPEILRAMSPEARR